MADKARSNFAGASIAGITDDLGNPLISPDTFGGSAFILGPSVYRLVVAGVANGDVSLPPADATALLSTDNPLPFFTWDNSAGTAITAQVVASGTAGSGNLLRFSVGTAVTSGTATLTRIEPITGTVDRGFSFMPQVTGIGNLNAGTGVKAALSFTWLGPDQSTTVGTAPSTQTLTWDQFYSSAPVTLSAGLDASGAASIYNAAPAGAAYLKMVLTLSATAAGGTTTRTLDVSDFSIVVGEPFIYLAETTNPNKYGAGDITQGQGSITIQSGAGTAVNSKVGTVSIGNGDAALGDPTVGQITLDAPAGAIDLNATTGIVSVSADQGLEVLTSAGVETTVRLGNTSTSGDLSLNVGGSDVILRDTAASGTNPRLLFRDAAGTYYTGLKAGAANVMQVLSGTSATTYGQLWAARLYPMNGSTASRYIFDNGTQTAFSGPILSGAITSTGNVAANDFTADTITGTTATTNAAIWVLTAGTTYNLRRNTSSARYKTNIVDADDVVLEAARRIKPRHYKSTIAEEAGATRLGFIAEEINDAGLTHAVGYDADGRPETIDSDALVAALWHRVNDLEARLAALEGKE